MATQLTSFYRPNLGQLKSLSTGKAFSQSDFDRVLNRIGEVNVRPDYNDIVVLLQATLSDERERYVSAILEKSRKVRHELFGNLVVPMAPIEVSNTCASDCQFCGWRVSNRAMKRLKMPVDLAMLQVEYLVDSGIHYIEFVSGDDISVVRTLLPELIGRTRELFDKRGIHGKISFCTLALTEKQYKDLKDAGADNMIVWQETYEPEIYRQHVVGGPKAFGVDDNWKVDKSGDGCTFRIESQERAMRQGLEVALGSMLGLNPDIFTEFLATVDHARYLADNYGSSPEHPLIIGMPIWNSITTRETDLRPAQTISMASIFPALSAIYLLSLPHDYTWVFPNCRVPLKTQILSAQVAGAFSSTEVKVGPGGYLPSILKQMKDKGLSTQEIEEKLGILLKDREWDITQLQKLLDEREQFIHHYHEHDVYKTAMTEAGLELLSTPFIPGKVAR